MEGTSEWRSEDRVLVWLCHQCTQHFAAGSLSSLRLRGITYNVGFHSYTQFRGLSEEKALKCTQYQIRHSALEGQTQA